MINLNPKFTYTPEIKSILSQILLCPKCKTTLDFVKDGLKCRRNHLYKIIDNVIIFRDEKLLTQDVSLSLEKWEKLYQRFYYDAELFEYAKNGPCTKSYAYYTKKFFNLKPNDIFLDLGCGIACNSFALAKKNVITINVDISLNALKISQKYFSQNGVKGIFICADIFNLPFQTKSFDFVFSTISLEYFENTEKAIETIGELLKNTGSIFCSLPILSFSTLTYHQLDGGIPDIPLIKNISKFVHIKLLKEKCLKHGYDKILRVNYLKKIFKKYFTEVEIGFFETDYELKFIKQPILKKIVRKILALRPFWPLVYVYSKK